jgi:hypothetical protein
MKIVLHLMSFQADKTRPMVDLFLPTQKLPALSGIQERAGLMDWKGSNSPVNHPNETVTPSSFWICTMYAKGCTLSCLLLDLYNVCKGLYSILFVSYI